VGLNKQVLGITRLLGFKARSRPSNVLLVAYGKNFHFFRTEEFLHFFYQKSLLWDYIYCSYFSPPITTIVVNLKSKRTRNA